MSADQPEANAPEAYHRWYYDNEVWEHVHWRGVGCLKSVSDMWNYQEIVSALAPGLIVEFGTRFGGSALFFADIGRLVNPDCVVFTVDGTHLELHPTVAAHPHIETWLGSSTEEKTRRRLEELRASHPGPVFAILDSDHREAHVHREMMVMRDFLVSGDYLVVEDGNINGHPVLPGWGRGPWEALERYFDEFPDDYERDLAREERFGFTFAPRGYLKRR
jgi:cephalosporin hydroxylase